jgi:alkaline phosphatase
MKITVLLTLALLPIGTVYCQQPIQENAVTSQSYDHRIPSDPQEVRESPAAKNIILLIGDGMGLSQISSAFYFKETLPHFARFHNIGLMRTSSTERITDSAAGATAFSAGKKTYNGAIGVDSDTISIPTIVEILSEEMWKTGMISTSSITHATPASFYAHVKSRGMEEEIAAQLSTSQIDFIAGGGLAFFADTSRTDGKDYLQTLKNNGFTIQTEQLLNTVDPNQKYAFLLAKNQMSTVLEGRGDFLPQATKLALNYLSANSDNFFLMAEGSMIDWGGHGNNADFLVSEMIDFDEAIGIALDFAEKDGNTLVIVTADHETGGFTLSAGETYDEINPTFSNGGHSTALVPVAAYGPGSELFRGIYENTEIFHKMMRAVSHSKSN